MFCVYHMYMVYIRISICNKCIFNMYTYVSYVYSRYVCTIYRQHRCQVMLSDYVKEKLCVLIKLLCQHLKVFLRVFCLHWPLLSVLVIMMSTISLRFVFVTVKTLYA